MNIKRQNIAAILGLLVWSSFSHALEKQDIGSVFWVATEYCPNAEPEENDYSMKANGQILSISEYEALYMIIGNTFGGNKHEFTFALPDLRSRTIVGAGTSSTSSSDSVAIGKQGGSESYTLAASDLPFHTHTTGSIVAELSATDSVATSKVATGSIATGDNKVFTDTLTSANTVQLNSSGLMSQLAELSTSETSGQSSDNAALDTRSPYLALTPCIVVAGIYPSRNTGAQESKNGASNN